ncbi:hypothetical protein dsmv_2887 [Desulfococcus multivorans DSM 2059]|uniref:Uncharacterized protein n=1 Tax=Desulfococcus multivorans DSM 2059 TaxID=1121405 RepID=S7TKW0_DESML|nr:hypothetical protein dsmv_2887 [Desulfococcus multivorans DSM 2059]
MASRIPRHQTVRLKGTAAVNGAVIRLFRVNITNIDSRVRLTYRQKII